MPEGPTLSLPIDASGARRGAQEFAAAIQLIEAAGGRAAKSIAGFRTAMESSSGSINQVQSATQAYIAQLNAVSAAQARAAASAKAYAAEMGRSSSGVAALGKSAADSASGFSTASVAVGSFVGGLATMVTMEAISFLANMPSQLISVSDAYGRLDDRINLYTKSMRDIKDVHADLLNVASRTGTSFQATGGFFAKVASQSKNLQLSYEEMIQLTETLQNAFKVSGASATETASAMQQLGQSFAKGRLNGDELVSVSENASRVMDALSEAFGVSQGVIRQWAEDGDLSAQAVAAAMTASSEKIRQEAESMGGTVEESSIRMQNAFNELLVKLNEATGASESAISALDGITSWMNSPSGTEAVNIFAGAIGGLVEIIGTLASIDISRISMIAEAFATARKAVQDFISGTSAIGKKVEQTLGYTAGGGMGGEYDTPGNITDFMGGQEKAFGGIQGLQMDPNAGQQTAITPATQEALRKKFGLDPNAGQGKGKGKGRGRGGGGAKKVDPSIAGLERARERLAEQQEDIELFGRERDQAIARAVESLGKYATPEMKAKSAEMAGTLFDLGQLQKQKTALDALSSSVQTFGNERTKAEASAVKQLGEFATPEQIQQAKDYAGQLIDLQARQEAADNAAQERQRLMNEGRSITESVMTAEEQHAAMVQNLDRLLGTVVVTQEDYDRSVADLSSSLAAGVISQEEYNAQVAKLGELLGSTAISQETYNRAVAAAAPPTWGSELLKLGDSLNSFDNQFQTLQSGIMGFTSLVSDAFTDAIFSGESFGVTLEKLGMSIAEMTTKLLIQLALQQAIGAGLQTAFAPTPGATAGTAPAAGGGGGGFFGLAKGGVIEAPLKHGIYTQPTYFAMRDPGVHAFAKGTGLLGEKGPEAILPLKRDAAGRLGVTVANQKGRRDDDVSQKRRDPESVKGKDAIRQDSTTYNIFGGINTVDRQSSIVDRTFTNNNNRVERDIASDRSRETVREGALDSSHISTSASYVRDILREKDAGRDTSSTRYMRDVVREKEEARYLPGATSDTQSYVEKYMSDTRDRESSKDKLVERDRMEKAIPYRLGGQVLSKLEHRIYNSPTYFHMQTPGETHMARGLGLLGEAGPEAVLPLTRTSTGTLGVRSVDPASGKQAAVLPLRRTASGVLGVERFAKGGVVNSFEEYQGDSNLTIGGAKSHTVSSGLSDNSKQVTNIHQTSFQHSAVSEYGGSTNNVSNDYGNVTSNAFSSLSTFAYGSTVRASLPHGIYKKPTLFPVDNPGYFPMARGTGVVGEAGPEAVLPLVRGSGGNLGVQSEGGGGSGTTVNVIVNNNSKADVSTEQRQNADGGTDVMLSIADHVENVVASRMMRSGTKVNRAVPQVGNVVAR